jgi:hypothetical protein
MKTYLFRVGDGNEGNFPRHTVNLTSTDCPFAALRALVLNMYQECSFRQYVADTITTDGEPEFGVLATVYEGPNGEQSFGAAWITAELEPVDEDPDANTLTDLLDSAAMADYLKACNV